VPYAALIKAIHQNAIEHGWWQEERDISDLTVLLHSELSEALEEYRAGHEFHTIYYSGKEKLPPICGYTRTITYTSDQQSVLTPKPEGVVVELADYVIRLLDIAGQYDVDIDKFDEAFSTGLSIWPTFTIFIDYLHEDVVHLLESPAVEDAAWKIARTLRSITAYCTAQGVELLPIVLLKHEYNKTRPFKHGGKKI
jgi:hypothetical protein